MHKLIGCLVAVVIALGCGAVAGAAVTAATTDHSIPACATESSDNCYWDAAHRGNGLGTSFVVIDGVVYH